MGDIFSEYIGVLAFLLFLVFPKIFRWVITRGGRAPSPIEKSLEDLMKGEVNLPNIVPESTIAALRADVDKLLKRTENLFAKAEELSSLCATRGGSVAKMQAIVESGAVNPFASLIKEIKRQKAQSGPPSEYEVTEKRSRLRALKAVLGILNQMVEQRIQPARSGLLGILDIAAEDCLSPYLAHAKRTGAKYTTRFALSVVDRAGSNMADLLESSAVAVAIVDPNLAELPRGWVNLVSDIAMDVCYSTRGLLTKLASDVGAMPKPVSISQGANSRILQAGLLGAWLPRIFGDVGAAVYLGPHAATGLAATLGRGSEEDRAIFFDIGNNTGEVPMHIRMFAMCRALYFTGFGDDAARIWESWQQRLGNPAAVTLKDASNRTASVPTALLLQAAVRAVDGIAAQPIAALGNQLLIHIPGLRCDKSARARMDEIAPLLIAGRPANAPSRIIIGAALAAAQKSPTVERKIGTAAMKSIAGKDIAALVEDSADTGHFSSVLEAASSPTAALHAVAFGALLSQRRYLQIR